MKSFLRITLFAIGLGMIAPNFIGTNINVNAEEVVKTDNKNKCQIRLVPYSSMTAEIRINEYLEQGYKIENVVSSDGTILFILSKSCKDVIKIVHTSDLIVKNKHKPFFGIGGE